MATLPSYFAQALKNIEPTEDADHAKIAHAEVRDVLAADAALSKLETAPVLIGSYARHVSIRRVKDVDLFARMHGADGDLRPGRALDLVEAALASYGSRVTRQARSFKVDFPDYELSVDVVPARRCGDHWEIPKKDDQDNKASWVETNPLKLGELTTGLNSSFTISNKGIYVPTVKLVRQIRRRWCGDQPGGLYFEILTYWAFEDGNASGSTMAEYVVSVLEDIASRLPTVRPDLLTDPTMDGKTILTKATNAEFDAAITGVERALACADAALAEEDECKSAKLWKDLLGNDSEGDPVFDMPEYCNADGTRVATGVTTAGALRSPAGTGRYA